MRRPDRAVACAGERPTAGEPGSLDAGLETIEPGGGNARLARQLLQRFVGCRVTGLEVDRCQHAKSLAAPQERLTFVAAGAQAISRPDASLDLALWLESRHQVPLPAMDPAPAEVHCVLRPGGWLYATEPVYAGALDESVRLFNDGGEVRATAQVALDRALANGGWDAVRDLRFETPVHLRDFADFERRKLDVTFAERRFDDALRAAVRARFQPHMTTDGAPFTRPMHARLLRRRGG